MIKLKHATVDERNAAFNVVYRRLDGLIGHLPFFQDQARAKLRSPEGRQEVLDGIDEALDAVEKVRAAAIRP